MFIDSNITMPARAHGLSKKTGNQKLYYNKLLHRGTAELRNTCDTKMNDFDYLQMKGQDIDL